MRPLHPHYLVHSIMTPCWRDTMLEDVDTRYNILQHGSSPTGCHELDPYRCPFACCFLLLYLLNTCTNKIAEKWMWMRRTALEFRMEL